MKLNNLKNILSADRYILLVGGKELQYRKSNYQHMFDDFGNYEIKSVHSFPSQDNAIEITLAAHLGRFFVYVGILSTNE